jgi:hypothetical protein
VKIVENVMRKLFMTCAGAAALFTIATFAPPAAQAMTLATPAGLSKAVQDNSLTENVAYVCRGGWGWRRCWWTPGWAFYRPAYYYRPAYAYYRPAFAFYRPIYRPAFAFYRPIYRPYIYARPRPSADYAFASARPAYVRPAVVVRPWWGWRARRGWW